MIKEINGNLFMSPAQVRCHQVNCQGVMGKGIAIEAKQRYPQMYDEYKVRCDLFNEKNLGDVQFYVSNDGTIIANMFAQVEFGTDQQQTDYESFENCLKIVCDFCCRYDLSVGFPYKVGCGLAGGDWDVIRNILESYFGKKDSPICYIVKRERAVQEEPVESVASSITNNTIVDSEKKPEIQIYTDGACSGNPGPGGWAAILMKGSHTKELSGGEPQTTNNRMELLGPINALRTLKTSCRVTIYSDSKYVCDAFNRDWLSSWQKNGWKTAKKEPVKNKDLWEELISLTNIHDVTWEWVKGHSTNPYNNRCDELAVKARQQY